MSKDNDTGSEHRSIHRLAGEIALALYQHRLLSGPQIEEILNIQNASVPLKDLRGAGLVNYVHERRRGGANVHYLTEAGLDSVETTGIAFTPRKQITREAAGGIFQAHSVAVNEACIQWLKASRTNGDDFGPLGWKHEQRFEMTDAHLITDAVLSYTQIDKKLGVEPQVRFLELDRGTKPLLVLNEQIRAYAHLHRYRKSGKETDEPLWTESYTEFPGLIVVFDDDGGRDKDDQEKVRHRTHSLVSLATADPTIAKWLKGYEEGAKPPALLVTLRDLTEKGPNGKIFYDLRDYLGKSKQQERYVDWLGAG